MTNIGAAFAETMKSIFGQGGDRPNAENIIFLITDGSPNIETIVGDNAIMEAKASGTRIIVIAIGEEADSNFIFDVASQPFEENVFFAENFNDLSVLVNFLRPLFCPSPVEPTPTAEPFEPCK